MQRILVSEHQKTKIFSEKNKLRNDENDENDEKFYFSEEDFEQLHSYQPRTFFNKAEVFGIEKSQDTYYSVQADYYVGLDWLIKGKTYIQVEPKINKIILQNYLENLDKEDLSKCVSDTESIDFQSNNINVDYLKMLLEIYSFGIDIEEIGDLVQIDWQDEKIKIEQKENKLTPFIIIQFLGILKSIVRKGLKKSYYKVQENLVNRVRGKVLLNQHIKENILKSQYTKTYCEYQVYGEDNLENQFLKKVFHFCIDYVQNNVDIFSTIHNNVQHIINFCRPSFEKISSNPTTVQLKNIKRNPFFNEYEEAIKIGSYILRQFDYNISATNGKEIKTPPFWIDMPKLFELYVYKELLRANFSHRFDDISYQFATYGNRLDFLIKDDQIPMIVDTKYKLHYQNSQIHNDIRQVSGYSRLNKVREKLEIKDDRNIDCLIIYPVLDKEFNDTDLSLNNIKQERQEIKSYYKIYKLGVHLPTI